MSDVNLATEQLLELLLTLKKTTPAAARGILNNQPAIAYALITLMVSMNAINIEVFQRTLAEFGAANASTSPTTTPSSVDSIMASSSSSAPLSAVPPHLQQQQQQAQYRTTTPPQTPPYASYPHTNGHQDSYTSTPPNNNMNNHHHGYGQQSGYVDQYQQQQQPGYPGYPPTSYSGQTPATTMPAPSSNLTDALASIPDEQKALIMRVLAMTPEQINSLPPTERSTYIQIRATLGIPTG